MMIKNKKTVSSFFAVGKRKTAIAILKLISNGSGKIMINHKTPQEFFPYKSLIQDFMQPLDVTENAKKFDAEIKVKGGGFSGQTGAIRLAFAKALIQVSEDFKKTLRLSHLLTRDSRIKERKKYGLKKARKAPQYSKR